MFGIQSPFAERFNGVHIAHLGKIFVIPYFDFLYLVRGTEAVEEMQERNSAFDGGKVCDGAEIHNFLHI